MRINKRFLDRLHKLHQLGYHILLIDNNISIVQNLNEILIEFDIDDWVDMDLTDAFIEALGFQIKQDENDIDISKDYIKELKKCLDVFSN